MGTYQIDITGNLYHMLYSREVRQKGLAKFILQVFNEENFGEWIDSARR